MVLIRRHEGAGRKYAKATRAGLIVCAALLVSAASSGAQQIAAKNNQNPHKNNQTSNSLPSSAAKPIIVIVQPSPQEVDAVAELEAANRRVMGYPPEDWVAFFTAVLSVSTIFLWWETRNAARAGAEQARLTRESIDLGNKEFVSSHRPRIVLRGISAFIQDPTKDLVVIRFKVHNTGTSKAIINDIKFFASGGIKDTFYFPNVVLSLPNIPYEIEAGFDVQAVAGSGKDWADIVQTGLSFVDAGYSKSAFLRENNHLRLRITIFYQDILGGRRQTSAHRAFDFFDRQFTRIEGSEFEYQD